MSDDPKHRPVGPDDPGAAHTTPDAMQIEAARLLANDARPVLRDRGFDDPQIDGWAETYVAEQGSGDVDGFVAWIARRQGGAGA